MPDTMAFVLLGRGESLSVDRTSAIICDFKQDGSVLISMIRFVNRQRIPSQSEI